jgi:hypothetical protein
MSEENIQTAPAEKTGVSFPQDYTFKTLNFVDSSGKTTDLKRLLVEFSYYEDIYGFVSSGYVTLLDAQGFIELLRLTGNEFIKLEFGKTSEGLNSVKGTFRAYKISDRIPGGNMNAEVYTIYFCSEELMLSEQNKLSKSYKGKKISEIVKDIVNNQLKVPTSKIEKIEDTMGVYDFVVPRLKPLEAISWLSTYARPVSTAGADMLFFQTKNGYNFRSLQSMMKEKEYVTYKYQLKNLGSDIQPIQEKVITVLDYELNKPYDILNEINSGTFANRLISIDPLSRTYKVTEFDYEKYKSQSTSLNKNSPTNEMVNRLGKKKTESYDSVLKVSVSNAGQQIVPYIKDKDGAVAKDVFVETYIPNRTAQLSLANYTSLKLSVPGDPGITAGRTIRFNILSLQNPEKRELDKFYSGKYLVNAVRHLIQVPNVYQTILEISKDSSEAPETTVPNSNPTLKKVVEE